MVVRFAAKDTLCASLKTSFTAWTSVRRRPCLVLAAQHVTVCRLALDARITWRGAPLVLSETRPTEEELLMDDDASARMAGYLIGRLTSRVRSRFADGVAELHLVFDH